MSELYDIDARRERLAGPAGVAGLFANKRLFGISMLTALGGLCYGYEQGACESPCLAEGKCSCKQTVRRR